LFVNDDDRFNLWVDRIIRSLVRGGNWQSQVLLREERFGRLNLIRDEITLKTDLARLLCSATEADWAAVRWVSPPPVKAYLSELNTLGEKLLLV